MAERTTTADAILAAAQRSIRGRGPEKLTLSAVAAEAGVCRPTLYRWFPTKALLVAALTAYEVEQFDLGLLALAAAHPDPADRAEAAIRYLVTYLDETMGPDSIGADPAFALQSLGASLAPQSEAFARIVGDALLAVPAVRLGHLSPEEASELFLRLAYSHFLFPHPDPEALLANLRSFAGLSSRAITTAAG